MPETDAFYAALDEGLAALAAGTPLADVARDLSARYPAYAAELPDLLAAAYAAGAGAPPAPPPSRAQTRSRAAFLGRAAALRQPARRRAWAIFGLPLARVALTALVFVGGFGAGTYGAVVASANALPGEALYVVKRTVENTELLLTGDPQARTELEATLTERRIDEVRRLTAAGRPAAVEFTGWLSALNGEHWVVAGLPVAVPAGTPLTGTPRAGVWVRVTGQVQPDRTVRADRVVVLSDDEVPLPTATPAATDTATPTPTVLGPAATPSPTRTAAASATRAATPTPAPSSTPQASATLTGVVGEEVEFTGVVESVGAGAWQIGGQAVAVNAGTEIRDNPQVGQTVEVRALRQADGSLLATRIRAEDSGGASASSTPGGGGGSGPSPSNTPRATDDNGGGGSGPSPSNTPGGGGGGGSGPSPSNTPEPSHTPGSGGGGGGGGGGPSPSNTPEPSRTPKPDDDSGGGGSGGGGGGGGGGGASATETPKPDDD